MLGVVIHTTVVHHVHVRLYVEGKAKGEYGILHFCRSSRFLHRSLRSYCTCGTRYGTYVVPTGGTGSTGNLRMTYELHIPGTVRYGTVPVLTVPYRYVVL
jgi:hypothetical protein